MEQGAVPKRRCSGNPLKVGLHSAALGILRELPALTHDLFDASMPACRSI